MTSKLNKDQVITKLSKHFKKHDNTYFIENILKIADYEDILKCLKATTLNTLIGNIKDDLSKSPNGPATSKPATSKPATSKPATIQSLDYLPFNTSRVPKDLTKEVELISKIRLNGKKQQAIMQFAQLFENDIIEIKDIFSNNLKLQIINYLSLRDNTLLYIGKVLESSDKLKIKDKNVVVKVQPRIPKELKLNFGYQVTTEYSTMTLLTQNCKDILIPKVYSYGSIEPLIQGDITRYILITELLGTDLSKSLKHKSVDNIKTNIIKALYSLQKMHKCTLGLVHFDIKHENIVFADSTEQEIKIIDFGSTESLFDKKKERILTPRKPGEGTPLYMSIMQHEQSIKDYMDDLQAFAWMLLDLLGDKPIGEGMPWYNVKIPTHRKDLKIDFIKNCRNDNYTDTIANGTLTKHNIGIIGELADYTMGRADKKSKYSTDLKTPSGLYYSQYNDNYYKDIANIINKLQ